jgi:hypothetical protein
VAARKQQCDSDKVYKITYKQADKQYYINVAALGFVKAIDVFTHSGRSVYDITSIEKTEQTVFYGRIA